MTLRWKKWCRVAGLGLLASSLLVACTLEQRSILLPAPAPAAVSGIAIDIGPCRGFCPSYRVTLDASTLTFVGERSTRVQGTRTRPAGTLLAAVAAELAPFRPQGKEVVISHETCRAYVTDQRSITVIWTGEDGGHDRLSFDLGCRDPDVLPLREALTKSRDALPIDDLVGAKDSF